MIVRILIAFVGMAVVDFAFARYTYAMAHKRPFEGASYAAALLVIQGAIVLVYVQDPWMLIPAAAGAFLGTYIGNMP